MLKGTRGARSNCSVLDTEADKMRDKTLRASRYTRRIVEVDVDIPVIKADVVSMDDLKFHTLIHSEATGMTLCLSFTSLTSISC